MSAVIIRQAAPTVVQLCSSARVIKKAAPTVIRSTGQVLLLKTDKAIIIRRNPVGYTSSGSGPLFDEPNNSAWLGII